MDDRRDKEPKLRRYKLRLSVVSRLTDMIVANVKHVSYYLTF